MVSLGYSIHLVCLLLGALLLQGFIKKMKARLQGKRGPSVLQPYYDIWKLFRKDSVLSEHASWVFRFAPYGVFVFTLTAALFVPLYGPLDRKSTRLNSSHSQISYAVFCLK